MGGRGLHVLEDNYLAQTRYSLLIVGRQVLKKKARESIIGWM